MTTPFKHILITGYYGFSNTGDEAILKSMLDLFKANQKNLTFTVVSGNPAQTATDYGIKSVSWQDIHAISLAVKQSDLVIIGGGGLFQDYWEYKRDDILTSKHHSMSFYGGIPILAKLHGKPYVLYSLGLGPITSPEAKKLMRIIAEQASLISVRDTGSKSLLESIGIHNQTIHVIPDPAFSLEPFLEKSKFVFDQYLKRDVNTPVLGVCLRNWDKNISSDQWQNEIAHALDMFITATQSKVLFIPFQSMPDNKLLDDISVSKSVIRKMRHADKAKVISSLHSADATLGLIGQCDLVLGMRLHSLIFAISSGIPSVGLSYDTKVGQLMSDCDLNKYNFLLSDFTDQQLASSLIHAYENREILRKRLLSKNRTKRQIISEFSQKTLQMLDTGHLSDTTPEFNEFIFAFSLDKVEQIALLEADRHKSFWGRIRSIFINPFVTLLRGIRNRIMPRGSRLKIPITSIKRVIEIFRSRGPRMFLQISQEYIGERTLDTLERILPKSKNQIKDLKDGIKKYPNAKGTIILLPSVKWNSSLFQRPQQLALAFSRLGYVVFYLELARPQQKNKYLVEIHERVYQVPIPARTDAHMYATPLPTDKFKELNSILAITYAYNRQFLTYLQCPHVVYEYIDELDVFPYDKKFIEDNHRESLLSADVIVATAKRLHDEVISDRPDAILCPNGVDYEHFLSAQEKNLTPIPADLKKAIISGNPVIGYYGALARWFDFDLVKSAALQRPDWNFVLIGTDYDNSLHPSGIVKLPNVHWLGARLYSDLPKYLCHFNVATIPFKLNDITHSTSPLKLFEYFAGHKPVVATAMHEVQRYDGVLIAHDVHEFIDQIENAMTLQHNQEYIAKIDKVARDNTWEKRATQILDIVK